MSALFISTKRRALRQRIILLLLAGALAAGSARTARAAGEKSPSFVEIEARFIELTHTTVRGLQPAQRSEDGSLSGSARARIPLSTEQQPGK